MSSSRRTFLKAAAGISAMAATAQGFSDVWIEDVNTGERISPAKTRLHVAVNSYTTWNLFDRDKQDFWNHLAEIKAAGADGIEPGIGSAGDAENTAKRLADAGLEMRSVYTGGNFYADDATAERELDRLTAMAEKAREYGTRVICSNPDAKSGKSDEEIRRQSAGYEKLGRNLADLGMKLGIHYHTSEWEYGGREFLHLMATTDPALVGFCFDTHWSYRASGNSAAAVQAHMRMWAPRCVEFHLRQSIGNVWSETFGDGDIDHPEIVAYFKTIFGDNLPHIVLEQAAEGGTPKTMTAPEVLKLSAEYVREIFG